MTSAQRGLRERMVRSRWFRWTIRISLGFLAILGVVNVALVVRDPSSASLIMAALIQPLVANTHPPPILGDQLAGANWRTEAEAGRKLTAFLQGKFPAGTSEGTLKSTLLNQRFKGPPVPPADCLPPGHAAPKDRASNSCPTDNPNKSLTYNWSNFPCDQRITIRWATDDSHNITLIKGIYSQWCL